MRSHRIAEDPTILGLGKVIVLDRERTQGRAGRLDILLSVVTRYEYHVEDFFGMVRLGCMKIMLRYFLLEAQRCPVPIADPVPEPGCSRSLPLCGLLPSGEV